LFLKKYKLPLDPNYAVAPHHTGIYPINPIVYEIWSHIMNFNITSTENYPYHYNLPSNRRGFIYRGLSVGSSFSFNTTISNSLEGLTTTIMWFIYQYTKLYDLS
jgi:hypothetical protein